MRTMPFPSFRVALAVAVFFLPEVLIIFILNLSEVCSEPLAQGAKLDVLVVALRPHLSSIRLG